MKRFLSSENSVLIYAVTNDDSSVFDPIEGETFADTTPHQHITSNVDRAFEFIEELK
jgi:hypothetical protein